MSFLAAGRYLWSPGMPCDPGLLSRYRTLPGIKRFAPFAETLRNVILEGAGVYPASINGGASSSGAAPPFSQSEHHQDDPSSWSGHCWVKRAPKSGRLAWPHPSITVLDCSDWPINADSAGFMAKSCGKHAEPREWLPTCRGLYLKPRHLYFVSIPEPPPFQSREEVSHEFETAMTGKVEIMSDFPVGSLETILVVDDNEMIRKLVVALLEDANFVVLSSDSGESAIKVAAKADRKIDLLLSDVQMPGMSGPTLCQTLKQSRPKMQVMLMTGGPNGDQLSKRYGWALIQKPFAPTTLLETVTTVLRSRDRSQLGGGLFEVTMVPSLQSTDAIECYA